MGQLEKRFIAARKTYEREYEAIHAALYKMLEDYEDPADEEYDATQDIDSVDDPASDIDTAMDRVQEEIARLED